MLHLQEFFAWDYKYVNIYIIFFSDILHQLYEDVVTNLVFWITKIIIKISIPKRLAKKRGHKRQLKLGQISKVTQLDEQFRALLLFPDLKLFQHYSKVVQWIGNEQKTIVKQLIIAAISLLIHNAPEAIQCTWAILNFTMLVQYILHHDKILRYMEHALYRFEKIKIAFEHYQSIDPKLCWLFFNYPKFYVINHFIHYIWNYCSVINYNIVHNESVYKYLLKAFYNKRNKKNQLANSAA